MQGRSEKQDTESAAPPALDLLGTPAWRRDGQAPVPLKHVDARLLAVVALDGAQPRDGLAARLWPEVDRPRAAASLRQRIKRLRQETGHALFRTGDAVDLLPEVVVDARDIGRLGVEALLSGGELLAGVDGGGSDTLDEWLAAQRERLAAARADALARHGEDFERRGDLATALRVARRVVELTPSHESAWRRLMQLHYLLGDRTAAIDAFERFERLLKEQTGARPGALTLALLDLIEGADAQPPLPCSEVPAGLQRPPRLVGRAAPWAAMERAWAEGATFLVVGEAGIGKSRLLADFARRRDGVLAEAARPGDAQMPYALLTRLLLGVHHAWPLAPDAATRRELGRLDADTFGPPPDGPAVQGLVWRAAERLLRQAADAGLRALLVDDLHCADAASVEALRWLSAGARGTPLRLGLASRPPDDGAVGRLLGDWLGDSRRPVRIALAPLDAAAVAELLGSLQWPGAAWPDAARLHRHAGGHPLFTLETLKDLHGQPDAAALPLPGTVQALLERRLLALPREAQDLLRVAAVAGADLSLDRAARLLGCAPVALAGHWSALERADVLDGSAFAHDLMRECALALVPAPVRGTLHAQLAALLEGEPGIAPARIAAHWDAAGRWPEAARQGLRAGQAARVAGRLDEQAALLARAAEAFHRAGDADGEFEARHAALDGLHVRAGGAAVLEALRALAPLARTPAQRLRCRLAEAEALTDLGRADEAQAAAAEAVAAADAAHRPDALAQQAMALALGARFDAAIEAARQAGDAARTNGSAPQALRAARALAYVLYAAGRLADAIDAQREALARADAADDRAEAAAAEGNLAALLGVTGDVPGSVAHARRVRARYREMGVSANSTLGCMNLVVLGVGAVCLGELGEALQALTEAVALAGAEAGGAVRAKARICLANLWLVLGVPAAAREAVAGLGDDTPPGMRMQAALVRAQAEQQEGGTGAADLDRLARLMAAHADLPLVNSAFIEWSHQGDAATVLAALAPVREQCLALGLPGTARAVRLREVARLLDVEGDEAVQTASRWAAELLPQVETGLGSKAWPPEAWGILARALERGGDLAAAANCRQRARNWLQERALPTVPAEHRATFVTVNPVNRTLLNSAEA